MAGNLNDLVARKGLDPFCPYEGIVVDNNDPFQIQQVRVRIPIIFDELQDHELPWMRPTITHPEGLKGGEDPGRTGAQCIPARGAKVNVYFPTRSIYEGEYTTKVRMTKKDVMPEFIRNYPMRKGVTFENGMQYIHDKKTNETFLILPGDSYVTMFGDVHQTVIGNHQLIVTDTVGDIPEYIKGDPAFTADNLNPDPKTRVAFKGLLGGKAGNQHTIVKGNRTVEVYGSQKEIIHGDHTSEVKGNHKLDVKRNITRKAGGTIDDDGTTIDLN